MNCERREVPVPDWFVRVPHSRDVLYWGVHDGGAVHRKVDSSHVGDDSLGCLFRGVFQYWADWADLVHSRCSSVVCIDVEGWDDDQDDPDPFPGGGAMVLPPAA